MIITARRQNTTRAVHSFCFDGIVGRNMNHRRLVAMNSEGQGASGVSKGSHSYRNRTQFRIRGTRASYVCVCVLSFRRRVPHSGGFCNGELQGNRQGKRGISTGDTEEVRFIVRCHGKICRLSLSCM